MTIIDSHMHIWTMARGDYDWLTPDLGDIYRDFSVDDVTDDLNRHGVDQVVLVQAAGTTAETDFMLSVARSNDKVGGVVGWIDFAAPDAVEQVKQRAADPHMVGLRPMIADLDDPDWVLRPEFAPVFNAMIDTGLIFDGHARPDLIGQKVELAKRHPDLMIVLNHGGKPPIASADLTQWKRDCSAIAACPNVISKFSGLRTEAGDRTDDAAMREATDHLLATFGPARLMWGSDWPVLTLAGDYAIWFEQTARLLDGLSDDDRAAIMGGTAQNIYFGDPS
ncbi:MAG: amidohydrolase family protein [Alphaproteobacteria bacterium]